MSPPPPPQPPSSSTSTNTTSTTITTTTTSTSSSSETMNNYLWIPILLALSKELTVNAQNTTVTIPQLLLPSESNNFYTTEIPPKCPPPSDPTLNFRPVIGILSHPGDGASGRLNNDTDASYIAASYVKFVESAGARVIPLIYNEPSDILNQKLDLVNGVLFTGGWAKSGIYFDVVQSIFKYVLRKNDAGDHFPLLAICLGFELVTIVVSKDTNILEGFNAADQASTLQFAYNVTIDGTVFQRFPKDLLKKLSKECLVMQNHRYGISPKKFQNTQKLRSFFKVLTTSTDRDGKVYVSTIQAQKYPITGVQWHPEKNAFEWGSSGIPHSEEAVQVTQHVANFFVRGARKSKNRPATRKVLDNLIYNYSPTYCGKAGRGFDEVYIFDTLKNRSPKL